MKKTTSKQGFTLIEVTVAIAIGSMVMLMVFSLVSNTRTQQQQMDALIKKRNNGSHVVSYIRRDLEGIQDLSLIGGQVSLESVVDPAGQQVLNFISSGRRGVDERGVVSVYNEVGYALKPHVQNPDIFALYRRQDYFIDEEPFRDGDFELLYEYVKSFMVEFQNADGEWSQEWTEPSVPHTLRMTIELLTELGVEEFENLSGNQESWGGRRFVSRICGIYKY